MAQMSALDVMISRTSPKEFTEPAPAGEALRLALEAAVAAPDHGRMRPWRFILIEGEARHAFGRLLAKALRQRKPEAAAAELEREAAKPLRAPLVIVVAARLAQRPGVPESEQVLAAGAAAQNLMLGLHAQGFGAAWKTGEAAYDPRVKAALGLAGSDAIVGFIYAGTPKPGDGAPPRPSSEQFVTRWQGVAADAAAAAPA